MKLEFNANGLPELQKTYADSIIAGGMGMITPDIGEDYWLFKVRLSDKQAIIGFPKFGTIGISFQVEGKSENTNLPYRCGAEEIYNHIKKNKGDKKITKKNCIKAIQMIQTVCESNEKLLPEG